VLREIYSKLSLRPTIFEQLKISHFNNSALELKSVDSDKSINQSIN